MNTLSPMAVWEFRIAAEWIEEAVAAGTSIEDAFEEQGYLYADAALPILAQFSPSVRTMLNQREQAALREVLDEAEPEAAPAAQRGRRRL